MSRRRHRALPSLLAAALLSLASTAHAAPFAYVTQWFTNTVAVVDTASNTTVATVPVGWGPFGVAVHPSGSHVYVGNNDEGTVSVIATASNTVVGTIVVGPRPVGLVVHPSGSRLYVANQLSHTVSVIDTATNAVVNTIDVGLSPIGLAVNPAGTRLYVVNNGMVGVSGSVSVVDTATLGVVTTVTTGQRSVGAAVDPTGARLYVSNTMDSTVSVINTATNTVTTTVSVATSPRGIAVHPSGSHVYVATGSGTVSVIAASSHSVVASPVVATGLYGIGVTPSGTHVYTASQDNGTVYALATATNTVSGQLLVSEGPTAFGLFVTPEASAGCDTGGGEDVNQALLEENEQLQSELAALRATMDSFMDRLFGGRVDQHVAAAARGAALAKLASAKASKPADAKVKLAQHFANHGEHAMQRKDWRRAVHDFRMVYELAERALLGKKFSKLRR
jgi:YVTN family beta-propeller protein